MAKPLRTGDIIRLVTPGYGEPTEDCVVIADQDGPLVWFTASTGGAAFAAQRSAVRLIKRKQESNPGCNFMSAVAWCGIRHTRPAATAGPTFML